MFQLSGKVSLILFGVLVVSHAWCIPAGQDNGYTFFSSGRQETSSWRAGPFSFSIIQIYHLPMDKESCGVIFHVFFMLFGVCVCYDLMFS